MEEAKEKIEGELIGQVAHYFDKIGVAVMKLAKGLKVGDKVRFVGGENTDFEQTVESLQIDHESIKSAKKGSEAAMKVNEKVREGYRIYKI